MHKNKKIGRIWGKAVSVKLLTLMLLASLAGCDGKAEPSASTSGPAGMGSYSLITQHRPESLNAYVQTKKPFYDACTTMAKVRKLPVEPFIELPADFVFERTTYQSDGKAYYYKQQYYAVDTATMLPETGCAFRIVESAKIERVRGNKLERVGVDTDGTTSSSQSELPPLASEHARDTSKFTVARTENGVVMRCLPASELVPGAFSAKCIVDDGAGGTLRDVDGSPLTAFTRLELSAKLIGVTRIEPVSVRIGKFDPAVFSGELK